MKRLLLQNVILDGRTTDVRIAAGRFERIAPGLSAPGAERLDGGGRLAVIPAFYNAHTHAAMTLLRGYADDLPLREWLERHIWPVEARMTAGDVYAGARLACVEMIRSGTVFFNDMYWHWPEAVRAASELGMRICTGPIALDAFDPSRTAAQRAAIEEFLARRSEWYDRLIPAITPHSIYGVRPESLRWIGERAAEAGVRLHIHLSETESEIRDCLTQHGVRPAVWLDRCGLLTPRTLAAHAIHLDEAERALLAERGVTLAHMPISNMKLANGTFDVAAARRAGLRVALGTDGCSSNNCLDLLQEMKCAALLAKHASGRPTEFGAAEAFRAATLAGAEAFGLDAGRIEEGRLADALLVDLDHPRLTPGHHLLSDMVYSAEPSVIHSVICGGRFLMREHRIPGEAEIIAAARAAARRLTGASRVGDPRS